jgi:hypothetical protein
MRELRERMIVSENESERENESSVKFGGEKVERGREAISIERRIPSSTSKRANERGFSSHGDDYCRNICMQTAAATAAATFNVAAANVAAERGGRRARKNERGIVRENERIKFDILPFSLLLLLFFSLMGRPKFKKGQKPLLWA